MDFLYLTPRKFEILHDILEIDRDVSSKDYIVIDGEENIPKFKTVPEIYSFKLENKLPSLTIIFRGNDKFCYLKITKWKGCWSLKSILSELQHKKTNVEFFKLLCEAAKRKFTDERCHMFCYIKIDLIHNYDISLLSDVKLIERVIPDHELESYNPKEIQLLTGKSIEDIIKLNITHRNIDFCSMCYEHQCDFREGGYHFNIETFDGKRYRADIRYHCDNTYDIYNGEKLDYEFVRNFLHQTYEGCNEGWYGYTDYYYENYIVILMKDSKYMYVHYTCDHASCAGFHFSVKSKIYKSFHKLWNKLPDNFKSYLIKANIYYDTNK